MDELEELMENKFYHPNVRLFYSGMKSSDCEIIKIDDDTLIKQMKQDIRMKDVQSLRDHFERFSQKYRSQTAFSQMYIKFLFANLLKDIYDAVPGEGEKQLNTKIDQLYRSFDFVQVTDIVSDSINLLEKTFSGRVQTGHREVEAVKRYIAAHYGDEMSVERLSELVYQSRQSTTSIGVTHRMGVGECLFCNLLVVNVLLYQLQTVFVCNCSKIAVTPKQGILTGFFQNGITILFSCITACFRFNDIYQCTRCSERICFEQNVDMIRFPIHF